MSNVHVKSFSLLFLRWPTRWDRGWCSRRSSSACWCVGAASRTPTRQNRRARGATPQRRTGPSTTLLSGIMSTSSPGRGEPGLPKLNSKWEIFKQLFFLLFFFFVKAMQEFLQCLRFLERCQVCENYQLFNRHTSRRKTETDRLINAEELWYIFPSSGRTGHTPCLWCEGLHDSRIATWGIQPSPWGFFSPSLI